MAMPLGQTAKSELLPLLWLPTLLLGQTLRLLGKTLRLPGPALAAALPALEATGRRPTLALGSHGPLRA